MLMADTLAVALSLSGEGKHEPEDAESIWSGEFKSGTRTAILREV